MSNLSEIKSQRVAEVPAGHLVGYWWQGDPHIALRVNAAQNASDKERGLLLLRLQPQAGQKEVPIYFDGCDHEFCLPFGPALANWDDDLAAFAPAGSIGGRVPGMLVIRPDGLAVVGVSGLGKTMWGLASGAPVPATDGDFYLERWQLGVRDIDGKFRSLIQFPYE